MTVTGTNDSQVQMTVTGTNDSVTGADDCHRYK
jgi:hypothetical protein